ncbi:MAG: hypothetical protein ABFS86_00985 [Planctomycetota bacterium]
MADDNSVPVWGIEAGDDVIRAVRLAPGEDGGFRVLEYREEPAHGPGPEAAVAFLKRRGLKRHAVAVAMLSPTSWFRSVTLSEDELARPRDDMSAYLSEYIPPEPEDLDFRWTVTGENLYLISAEIRARVESYMIALESAQVYAYGLLGGIQALHAGVQRSGLLDGDGIVIRVLERWTDVLFLDDGHAARQALPVGRRDLRPDPGSEGGSTEAHATFAADLGRLLEYHRTRVPREEPERVVLLGPDETTAAALSELLPGETLTFPADAAPLSGGSGLSLTRALAACRAAPAAVGAALSAVSAPRNEELSLRSLPTVLPKPPAGDRTWCAAAALLWIALLVGWFGLARDRDRLKEALSREMPARPAISRTDAAELSRLAHRAGMRLSFPRATARALAAVPGEAAAPFRTERLSLTADPDGAYRVQLTIVLPGASEDMKGPRVRAAIERFRKASGRDPILEGSGGEIRLKGSFPAGGGR